MCTSALVLHQAESGCVLALAAVEQGRAPLGWGFWQDKAKVARSCPLLPQLCLENSAEFCGRPQTRIYGSAGISCYSVLNFYWFGCENAVIWSFSHLHLGNCIKSKTSIYQKNNKLALSVPRGGWLAWLWRSELSQIWHGILTSNWYRKVIDLNSLEKAVLRGMVQSERGLTTPSFR